MHPLPAHSFTHPLICEIARKKILAREREMGQGLRRWFKDS